MPLLIFIATLLVFIGGVVAAATAYRHHQFLNAFQKLQESESEGAGIVADTILRHNITLLHGARPRQQKRFWQAILLVIAGNAILVIVAGFKLL